MEKINPLSFDCIVLDRDQDYYWVLCMTVGAMLPAELLLYNLAFC